MLIIKNNTIKSGLPGQLYTKFKAALLQWPPSGLLLASQTPGVGLAKGSPKSFWENLLVNTFVLEL